MNYKFWFLLVACNSALLFLSFFKGSLSYALLSLLLALYLKKSHSKIKFPKLTILGHEIKNKNNI